MKLKDRFRSEKERQDIGFGTQVTNRNARLIQPNGRFNVQKINQSFIAKLNLYHNLITMSRFKFLISILFFYLIINLLFASIYYVVGTEQLNGIQYNTEVSPFWQAFFFSSQTMTTLGYGQISPASIATNWIASIEALFGLMAFAIMTGILYGRFARPESSVLFSDHALISPYLDGQGLMIRIVNERDNQLINVSAKLVLSRNEWIDGKWMRKYYNLELERTQVTYFAMSWTLVHPITESSLLYRLTKENIEESDTEILLTIEGMNDTYFDMIHVRRSYIHSEIIFDAKFDSMLQYNDNIYIVELSKIGQYSMVNPSMGMISSI